MEGFTVLDATIIKDLSNHIYEKRKATAFQIESLTKSALARNDSQTIYTVIGELSELINSGSNSGRMGGITALGSVSVALGSFAIAYFLDDIIKPIFTTFKDTDARVRYYACESLYNIAKIARGEILLYFNEVFDALCVLVTDSESSVKNAADILDRLIKDIVSAKATNYVSILQQQNDLRQGESEDIQSHFIDEAGTAVQVNNIQDSQKAFSLPKFIPTLLERMYTIDPFAKKFLISWLELFDDIPSLELITFLPNFLEPLIKFLKNNSPSDVRIESQNILNVFLKEIRSIQKVKYEASRRKLVQEKKDQAKRREVLKQKSSSEEEKSSKVDQMKNELDQSLADELKSTSITDSKVENEHESIQSEENKVPEQDGVKEDIEDDAVEETGEEQFLDGQNIFIDYHKIIGILLSFLRSEKSDGKVNDLSGDSHEIQMEIQFIVLRWLQEIIQFAPLSFTNYFPECVALTMRNTASADNNKDFELRNQFLKFNLSLQSFFIKLNEAAKKDESMNDLNDSTNTERKDQDPNNSDIEDFYDITIDEHVVMGLTKEVYDELIEFQLDKTLHTIMRECLTCANELARITLLDWLIFLYSREPTSFISFEGEKNNFDLKSLLQSATDSSNEVILKVLQLLSRIAETNQVFFKDFMVKLINFLEQEIHDTNLDHPSMNNLNSNSQTRGNGNQSSMTRNKVEFIIRKLCVTLDSEKIFSTMSEVLVSIENLNLEFLNMMIVTLNNILLTTPELTSFRKKLKNLDVYKLEDWNLFSILFQSWCHNPASAFSLCLLTSNYDLAFLIIKSLSELEVTFQLLTQLDILVQLLESPIFLKLRLQLLEPEKNPYLFKALYGLLMILPQSSTFTTLHNRLSSVSSVNSFNSNLTGGPLNSSTPVSTPGPTPGTAASSSSVSQQLSIKRKRVYEMLDKFTRIQELHEGYQIDKKIRESATSSLYQSEDVSGYHRSLVNRTTTDSHSRPDRLLSYGSSHSDTKDYFPSIDSLTSDNKSSSKRVNNNKFRYNS